VQRGDNLRAKPEPNLFIECARRLWGRSIESDVLGDAARTCSPRGGARMLSIGVLFGGYGEDELTQAGAFRVYRDAEELHESLGELGVIR